MSGRAAAATTTATRTNANPKRLWRSANCAPPRQGCCCWPVYVVGWADGPRPVETGLYALALAVGAATFVPSTLRRLASQIEVGTLMTIAAVGAVILGEGRRGRHAGVLSISEGEYLTGPHPPRVARALLSLVPDQATVLRGGT